MDTPAAPAPVDVRTPLWEDFLDVFYAPRQVFARRPEGRWALPLLVLAAVMAFLFFASQGALEPAMSADFERAMRNNPDVTPEQMAQARRMSGVFGLLGIAVGFPIGVVVTGAVLWAVGKLFDSAASLGVAVMIVVYAQFPRLLQQLLALVQGLVMDEGSLRSFYSVSLSPARFLDPDATDPLVLTLAGRLDLFLLWSTVLIAIGLQVRGGVPRAPSYLAAALVWLLGAVPLLLGALAGG